MAGLRPAGPGRAVWRGPDIQGSRDWLFPLSAAAAAELRRGLEPFAGRNISPDILTDADLPTPVLRAELASLSSEVSDDGLGFAVLRGVSLEGYDGADLEILHWAIGKSLGSVITQGGPLGYIAHVRDRGADAKKEYYAEAGGPLPMHMDPADVAALLCLNAARDGGTNLLVSSAALHDRLLERHPDVLARLYRGFAYARPDETGKVGVTAAPLPVFFRGGDQVYSTYLPAPIHRAVERGMAELDEQDRAALAVLDREALSEDLVVAIDAEPGDVLFLNNRTVLHSRTDYVDWERPEDRRHLLRVWMHMAGWRPMPAASFQFVLSDTGEKIFRPDALA